MTEIINPTDEVEMAAAVKEYSANGTPVEIVGGGTRVGFGHPSSGVQKICTRNLKGTTLYEPGALTIVAKAGTPLADLKSELAAEGQHFPFEPADYAGLLGNTGKTTIGGVVACGISGPRRIQAGSCRDSLIGVRFINGEGEAVSNGGRVMKNVTGYDLVKLLCGSHGTLGLLTEVSFKLLPKPECSNTLQIFTSNIEDAISAMSDALTSPYDVTGAAFISHPPDMAPHVVIRVEGFENSVEYRTKKLNELLGGYGEIVIPASGSQQIWSAIGDVSQFAGKPGAVWRISVKPSSAPKIAKTLSAIDQSETLFDWGGGLIWALVPEIGDCSAANIRQAVNDTGGHATLVRASVETKNAVPVFHPQHSSLEALEKTIKAGFDPGHILNPGRMGI